MKFIIFILITTLSIVSLGQDVVIPDYRGDNESFKKVKDKALRIELATFTIEGSKEYKPEVKLKEIPLIKSANSYCVFQKGNTKIIITQESLIKANIILNMSINML